MPQSQQDLLDALNQRINGAAAGVGRVASASDRTTQSWLSLSGLVKSAVTGLGEFAIRLFNASSHVDSVQRSFKLLNDYGLNAGPVFDLGVTDLEEQLMAYQELLIETEDTLESLAIELNDLVSIGASDAVKQRVQNEIDAQVKRLDGVKASMSTLRSDRESVIVDHARYATARNFVDARNKLAGLAAAEVALLGLAISHYKRINDGLILSNSLTTTRRGLIRETLRAQIETGNQTDDIVAATRQLTEYGEDLNTNFGTSLSLVSKLEEGLGIGVEHGAQLVFYFGTRLKTSVEQVAGLLSTVVNQTALSASKAAEYAVNMAKVGALFKDGIVTPEATLGLTRYILNLEAAAQRTTGVSGEFQDLVTRLSTSVEGMQQARVLGMTGLNDLRSATGLETLITGLDRLARRLDSMDMQSKVAEAEQLSKVVGLSQRTLMQLTPLLEEYRRASAATATEQVDLSRRWTEQVSQSGQVLERLKNSLLALVHYGLAPALSMVTSVVEVAVGWLESISKSKSALSAVTVALTAFAGVVGAGAAVQVGRLTLSLMAMATAANLAATAALKNAGVTAGGGVIGRMLASLAGLGPSFSGLGTGLAVLGGQVVLLVGAIAGLSWIIGKLVEGNRVTREMEEERRRGVSKDFTDKLQQLSMQRVSERLSQEKFANIDDAIVKKAKASVSRPEMAVMTDRTWGDWFRDHTESWLDQVGEWTGIETEDFGLGKALVGRGPNIEDELDYAERLVQYEDNILGVLKKQHEENLVYHARAFQQKIATIGPDKDTDRKAEELRLANEKLLAAIKEQTAQLKAAQARQEALLLRQQEAEAERDRRSKLTPASAYSPPAAFIPAWKY